MAPQRKTANQQQRQPAAHDNSSAAGPAARTRAGTRRQQQQHQQYAADMVFPLLLQHDSVRTRLRLICSLLCCSKALAAAVAEHCGGQMDIPRRVTATAQGRQQLAAWLHKHARLVRSLDLHYTGSYAARGVVLAALMAAGPQTLTLQSLKAWGDSSNLRLLEQLPAHSLTHLDWRVEMRSVQHRPAFVARLLAALGRLTGLRALALDTLAVGSGELPGLSGLTQLTSLRYKGPESDLQHVPPQLLELELPWRQQQQPLELARLTALTHLSCLWLTEGDVLPADLQSLRVSDCQSWQPLLGLQRLQQLDAYVNPTAEGWADITVGQLRQLSRLSALTLGYSTVLQYIAPASAAAWPLLQLQRLQLSSTSLSAAVCQSLAQLSGLTSLQLRWFKLPQEAQSGQQLAAALRRLSCLQQLYVNKRCIQLLK